jgi:hypothetical protein
MTLRLALVMAALATLAIAPSAQPYDLTLHHMDVEDLGPVARRAYEEAVTSLDHADHITAVQRLGVAAEASPEAVELQLHYITLTRQVVRPDNYSLDEILMIAERSVAAYERALDSDDLPSWARTIAQRELEELQAMLANIDETVAEYQATSSAYFQRTAALHERTDEIRQSSTERLEQRRTSEGPIREANPRTGDGNPRLPTGNVR